MHMSATRRTRRTQAERTEETRARILVAAVHVLSTRGYAGFRTAEVATQAGVSRGALTHHFPSRDELLVAPAGTVRVEVHGRDAVRLQPHAGGGPGSDRAGAVTVAE